MAHLFTPTRSLEIDNTSDAIEGLLTEMNFGKLSGKFADLLIPFFKFVFVSFFNNI